LEQPITEKNVKPDLKGTLKDSVFRNLFGQRKYALQLYQAIHPEDTEVTEDDIGDVTIDNILIDQQYNDLGMTVRGTLLVLLEAQATWTMNIIIRILLYLAFTWNRIIEETNQNRYGSKKLKLPKPEFYVVYTGSRKERPKWIHLSNEFLEGNTEFLEMNVRILYGDNKGDIISQYIDFTIVYQAQVSLYGRTRKAILETIQICKDKNILKDYLASREKEVIDIMMSLFDQERAMEQYGNDKKEEGRLEGRLEGEMKKARETALKMKEKGYSDDAIADILEIELNTVQYWISDIKAIMPQ
jgi:hypothetical protein